MADPTFTDFMGAVERMQSFEARDQRTNDLCMQLMAQQAAVLDAFQAMAKAMQEQQATHAARMAEMVQALQALSIKVELPPEPPEPPESEDKGWSELQVSISQGMHAMPKVMTITKAK